MSNCGCLLELIQQCDFTFRIHSTCVVFMGICVTPKLPKVGLVQIYLGQGSLNPYFTNGDALSICLLNFSPYPQILGHYTTAFQNFFSDLLT